MTSKTFLARFDQRPALVDPEQQMAFDACIEHGAAFLTEHASDLAAAQARHGDDDFWSAEGWEARYRPYKVSREGTLHIPVKGVLLHNFPYAVGDWLTGYDYIAKALERGLADPQVKRIALIVDSPGGEVAGCFECADKVFAARSIKPVAAFAHESAYSAAYALASAASTITVSRTGGVGSIGVVTSHMDVSERMKAMGVKITFIHAGKHKVDGNAYEPLSADVKAKIQARIDELYGVFVTTVSRHRGMDEEAVRATEAATFTATEATSNGLADKIGPLDESLASFEAELSNQTENEQMSTESQDNSAAIEAAVAEARESALSEGRTEGATAERQRISAIEALDEAQSRPVAARNVAMNTNMTVEEAQTFLAGLNEETTSDDGASGGAGAGANRFDNAMRNGNPELNGNAEGEDDGDENATAGEAGANALLASRKAATGFGKKSNA